MQSPDSNGFVNVTWPSKNIPHGGIFHTRVAEPTETQHRLLKLLLEESKLTIAQRQKSALKLRENDERKPEHDRQVRMPQVRPRTSHRRSLSSIRESGVFDMDRMYRPMKRGEDREKMKERLANKMAYGEEQQQKPQVPATLKKPQPKLPTSKEIWNDLVTQIRERSEWLAEMEYLGQADPHRDIIKDQIAERMRALDALGIDSECSTPKSTASGFSTRMTEKPAPKDQKVSSSRSDKSEIKRSSRSTIPARNKEENVAAYAQLSPLQYTPRRRV